MGFVDVNTTQNVRIQFKAASAMHRVAAYAIDIIFLVGFLFAGILLVGALSVQPRFYIYSIFFFIFLYPFLAETILGGQTIGKRFMKIRVVRTDGAPASVVDYFIRWLLGLIEIAATGGSLAFLMVIISKKSQRLGDMVAGTTVVSVGKPVSLDDLALFADEAASVSVPEAVVLTDIDVETIRQVLISAKNGTNRDTTIQLAWDSAIMVRTRLGTGPFSDPMVFLSEVLESYRVLHRNS